MTRQAPGVPAAARPARRGAALVWAVVILALLAALLQLSVRHVLAARRQLDRRHSELQTDWLARAGLERAAARLLAAPDYTGESLAPIPGAQVLIEVKQDLDLPSTYQVTSAARYPTDGNPVIVRSLSRRFRRKVEEGRARMDVLAGDLESRTRIFPFFLGPP